MKNGCGEYGAGFAIVDGVGEVIEGACATGGDDGHFDGFADSAVKCIVKSSLGAVGVHAGQEDFAGAKRDNFLSPFDCVESSVVTPAMGVNFPAILVLHPFGIDCDDDALVAELSGCFVDEIWIDDGCGVEADFVGPSIEHIANVFYVAQSATDGEWHEALVGGTFNHVDHGVTLVAGGSDVEEYKFVGALLLIGFGLFDGIAGIDQIDKIHAFDNATLMNI